MGGNFNTWLQAYFDDNLQDVTPNSASHEVRVLYAPISNNSQVQDACAEVLSKEELDRAHRMTSDTLKAKFMQRRAFRRFCAARALGGEHNLSEIRFDVSEKGRPYLSTRPDLWFSFSSCSSGILGAWSATHAVGIDIEDLGRATDTGGLARRFFAEPEATFIATTPEAERPHTFLKLWCLKEAALKSIGEGLPFGLEAFEFTMNPEPHLKSAPSEHGPAGRFKIYLNAHDQGYRAVILRDLT